MKITEEKIRACLIETKTDLLPTQYRLCIPIINRIYQKMIYGLLFDEIRIHDNLIIDGHHRYISSLLAAKHIKRIPTNKTSATRKYEWEEIEFANDEWDTPEKIEKLNQDDAEFNNLPVHVITEITK